MNPLAGMFNRGNQMPGRMNNAFNMMQQFQQFRNNFQGDPKQAVMNMLANGQMTKEQFDQLSQMARFFQNNMK